MTRPYDVEALRVAREAAGDAERARGARAKPGLGADEKDFALFQYEHELAMAEHTRAAWEHLLAKRAERDLRTDVANAIGSRARAA